MLFAAACKTTVPGPVREVEPFTVIQEFVFSTLHCTISATDTSTEHGSPDASNSYPFDESADCAAGCVTLCVFAVMPDAASGVIVILPVRCESVGLGDAE